MPNWKKLVTSGSSPTFSSIDVRGSAIFNDDGADADFRVESDRVTHALFVDAGNNTVGIGTSAPKTPLSVFDEDDIISGLSTGDGGGEIVTYGTLTFSTAAGELLYMSTAGKWYHADSDALTTGAYQLLGLAMGTTVADGILLRGHMNVSSGILAHWDQGLAVYVTSTDGNMDTVAPTTSGHFVRVVGYCTDTANVMYFNPGTTWVEIA